MPWTSASQRCLSSSRLKTGRRSADTKKRHQKSVSLQPTSQIDEQAGAAAAASQEQELIRRVIAGDSEAQTRLFATHTAKLYRIALKVLGNKEDAEDAVQDGLCRAYSKLHTFQGRSSLSTWLTQIVINSALMTLRRNKHHLQTSLDGTSDDQNILLHNLVDGRPNPEKACINAEMNSLLAEQIRRLPPTTQQAFLLCYVEGRSRSESVELFGVSSAALKSRVNRACRKLASALSQFVHTDRQQRLSLTT